jgi:hypothetical protein
MSDMMLLGILRMPFDDCGSVHLIQLKHACEEAASVIENLRAELAKKDEEIAELQKAYDRVWKDRYDLLGITSTDSLLSSEWVMRTARAEVMVKEKDEEIANLKKKFLSAENTIVQNNAILESISVICQNGADEANISDFMLSFPEVREVFDIKNGSDFFRLKLNEKTSKLSNAEMELARLQALLDEYMDAITWALGANGDFRSRNDGEGSYWWRKELQERAGLVWNGEKFIQKIGEK